MIVIKSEKKIVKNLKKGILICKYKMNDIVYELKTYEDEVYYINIFYSSGDTELELYIDKKDWSYGKHILKGLEC